MSQDVRTTRFSSSSSPSLNDPVNRSSQIQSQRVHTLAPQKHRQDEMHQQLLITELLSDIQQQPVADHSGIQIFPPAPSLVQMEIFTGDVEYGVLPADVLCSVPMPTASHGEKRPRKRRLKQVETRPLDWDHERSTGRSEVFPSCPNIRPDFRSLERMCPKIELICHERSREHFIQKADEPTARNISQAHSSPREMTVARV